MSYAAAPLTSDYRNDLNYLSSVSRLQAPHPKKSWLGYVRIVIFDSLKDPLKVLPASAFVGLLVRTHKTAGTPLILLGLTFSCISLYKSRHNLYFFHQEATDLILGPKATPLLKPEPCRYALNEAYLMDQLISRTCLRGTITETTGISEEPWKVGFGDALQNACLMFKGKARGLDALMSLLAVSKGDPYKKRFKEACLRMRLPQHTMDQVRGAFMAMQVYSRQTRSPLNLTLQDIKEVQCVPYYRQVLYDIGCAQVVMRRRDGKIDHVRGLDFPPMGYLQYMTRWLKETITLPKVEVDRIAPKRLMHSLGFYGFYGALTGYTEPLDECGDLLTEGDRKRITFAVNEVGSTIHDTRTATMPWVAEFVRNIDHLDDIIEYVDSLPLNELPATSVQLLITGYHKGGASDAVVLTFYCPQEEEAAGEKSYTARWLGGKDYMAITNHPIYESADGETAENLKEASAKSSKERYDAICTKMDEGLERGLPPRILLPQVMKQNKGMGDAADVCSNVTMHSVYFSDGLPKQTEVHSGHAHRFLEDTVITEESDGEECEVSLLAKSEEASGAEKAVAEVIQHLVAEAIM